MALKRFLNWRLAHLKKIATNLFHLRNCFMQKLLQKELKSAFQLRLLASSSCEKQHPYRHFVVLFRNSFELYLCFSYRSFN